MFCNQISTRDLFAGSQNSQDRGGYGDASRDFSQLQNAQYTQCEMSQQCSQDFFSQPDQYSAGSNSETQGRRVPIFEKYMSKPSLFRTNSQSKIPSNRSKNQNVPQLPQSRKPAATSGGYLQQVTSHKAKAKEKDERDMLSSIVSIVRECSEEVKHNLSSLSEADHDTGDALKTSIKALSSSIEGYSSKIMKAVQTREEHNDHVAALHKEIRKKDEQIQELMKQMSDCSGTDNAKSVLDAMKTFLSDQQSHTQQKLQRILEATQEQLKHTKDIGSGQRSGAEENNKHYLDIKYSSQRLLQDTEKRLLDELTNLRDDFERQKRDMESFYRSQVQTLQQKHVRDFEQQIQRGIDNSVRQTKETIEEFYKDRQSEIKDLCRSQQKDIEKYIKTHNSDQSKHLLKQNQDFYNKQQKELQTNLHKKLDELKTQQETFFEESKKSLEVVKINSAVVNERPWQNENVPKNVQDQLDKLHNQHQSEIKRLEMEIENQRNKEEIAKAVKGINDSSSRNEKADASQMLQNVYDIQADETNKATRNVTRQSAGSLFQKSSGFLSPRPPQGTTWNSRNLFGRINPSPIATVLPQRKPEAETHLQENTQPDQQNGQPTRQLRSQARNSDSMTEPTDVSLPTYPSHLTSPESLYERANRRKEQSSRPRMANGSESIEIVNVENPVETVEKEKKACKELKKNGNRKGRKRKKCGNQSKVQYNKTQAQPCGVTNQVSQRNDDSKTYSKSSAIPPTLETETVMKTKIASYKPVPQVFSTRCMPARSNDNLSSAVFDFHDEMSPGPTLRMQRNSGVQPYTSNRESVSDRNWMAMASQTSSEESSQNSSPSMSVTEVFIRRRVRCAERRTSEIKEMYPETKPAVALPDFLSTPNLTDSNTDTIQGISTITGSTQGQGYRSIRRQGEKRKLCDFDTQVIQMMQCSQTRRSKYSA